MNRYNSVQCLRAVAAMSVVAFHASAIGSFGQAGVDVFFVISGFIMWLVTQREVSPKDFLAHRLVRIWPLYAVATIWMAAHLHAQLIEVVKSLAFIPYSHNGNAWPVLIPGWTLNLEMFFYLLFSCALMLPRLKQFAALSITLSTLVALGFVFHPASPVGRTYTSPLLLEFLAGIVIGRITLSGSLPHLIAGGGLVALGLVGLLFSATVLKPDPFRVLIWGFPAASLVLGAISLEVEGVVPHLRWLSSLGEASFSIYLFHSFMLKTFEKIAYLLPAPLSTILLLVMVGAAGLLIFNLLEQRLTRLIRPMVATLLSWRPYAHRGVDRRDAGRRRRARSGLDGRGSAAR